MENRQYIACKFRAEDSRSYTYAYDGDEPLSVGDQVKVPDNRSDGWKRVTVVAIGQAKPAFECKLIIGKVEPEADSATPAAA